MTTPMDDNWYRADWKALVELGANLEELRIPERDTQTDGQLDIEKVEELALYILLSTRNDLEKPETEKRFSALRLLRNMAKAGIDFNAPSTQITGGGPYDTTTPLSAIVMDLCGPENPDQTVATLAPLAMFHLLQIGADPSVPDKRGKTTWNYATRPEVREMLKSAIAEVDLLPERIERLEQHKEKIDWKALMAQTSQDLKAQDLKNYKQTVEPIVKRIPEEDRPADLANPSSPGRLSEKVTKHLVLLLKHRLLGHREATEIRELLELEPDVNSIQHAVEDSDGTYLTTPLSVFAKEHFEAHGFGKIMKLLVAHTVIPPLLRSGANPNVVDGRGKTTWDYADQPMQSLLIKYGCTLPEPR